MSETMMSPPPIVHETPSGSTSGDVAMPREPIASGSGSGSSSSSSHSTSSPNGHSHTSHSNTKPHINSNVKTNGKTNPNGLHLSPMPSPTMKLIHLHHSLLDHSDHPNVNGDEPDGIRTPRPKTFTPSPPVSPNGRNKTNGQMGKNIEGEGEMARLMRTIDFAARKHSCQRRKDLDQTPYINHPIAVANFLSGTGISDVRVLQAAILHDTVEDTHTTIDEIAENFGADVAVIVAECTDNPSLSGMERKTAQVRTAPFKSREAQQVKLADKLHNLESIRRSPPVGWGSRRVQAYFVWAKQVTDICAPSHPALAEKLQELYETAYTMIDGQYIPCHPEVCGPLTEAEKSRIDHRLGCLKKGEKPCPHPLFF